MQWFSCCLSVSEHQKAAYWVSVPSPSDTALINTPGWPQSSIILALRWHIPNLLHNKLHCLINLVLSQVFVVTYQLLYWCKCKCVCHTGHPTCEHQLLWDRESSLIGRPPLSDEHIFYLGNHPFTNSLHLHIIYIKPMPSPLFMYMYLCLSFCSLLNSDIRI